ncbi:MAG: LPS export ABC transporter permease LptG [Rhodospirillaceae bacterium]
MRISAILSLYVGRHFLISFVGIFSLFLLMILLFDAVELLRRTAQKPDISFGMVMEMSLLKLPFMAQKTLPFAILFGGMTAFWRLTRTNELVVTRAAGVSAWQFMWPVLFLALGLGVFQVTVMSPLASSMLAKYDQLETTRLEGHTSFLSISNSGLWLRQADSGGQSVIHAKRVLQHQDNVELKEVIVFLYQGKDVFTRRVDAASARLEDGFWHLKNAKTYEPEAAPKSEPDVWLETNLTINKIHDNFAPPETMSFWELPGFIETLETAGFSAVRHRLYWHTLLATPLLLSAMILIAATFTLRQTQRGGTTFIITGGVLTGFLLYFFSDIIFALGLSDNIPVLLAAWTPSGVATMLGVATLLHLEDG